MTKKISTTKNHIIFDIDSTTIGGGIFRYDYDSKGVLVGRRELFVVRKKITNGSNYSFDDFLNKTLKTLHDVASEVYLQSLITIDTIYCNVSAPWMSSQKRKVTYTKNKPFIFTADLEKKLVEKELSISLKKNLDYAQHDVALIDRQTVNIYGNGYAARKPLGTSMTDVCIHSLVSVMSRDTKKLFEEAIEKVFHRDLVFVSNTFVSYQALRTRLPHTNDAIIMDISGELTEVLVVKKDNLVHIGSIPVGSNHVVRTLSTMLAVPYAKADHLLSAHQESFDLEYISKIQQLIKKSFRVWFKEFFNLCDEYSKKGLLPGNIVLRCDPSYASWFDEMILGEDMLQEHIHTADRVNLQHFDAVIGDLKSNSDIELAVISDFIESQNM